ncbi:hypothetical protein L218DRAFT_466711 [Marasmius fiardii PR-910]|nr:hypothetical protein L218DRAFT_466711 [Marasmius fiardii PR-910]
MFNSDSCLTSRPHRLSTKRLPGLHLSSTKTQLSSGYLAGRMINEAPGPCLATTCGDPRLSPSPPDIRLSWTHLRLDLSQISVVALCLITFK